MPLRFATFNIRNGDADDGSNSWPYRHDALIEMLRQLDADVLGLQEVLHYQLQFILERLPEYESVGVGRIDGKTVGEYAPILYRRDLLQVSDSGWFWLSETPEVPGSKSWDTACERICTWAQLEANGQPIFVMNTHLDHISAEAQLRGTLSILERCRAGAAVVMGDFNSIPSSPPRQAMRNAGFLDSGGETNISTFHDWGKVQGDRIDYIFARQIQIGSAEIVTQRIAGRHPSDHYPVVTLVG